MNRYIDAIPFAQAVSDLRNKEREEYDNLVGKHRSLARSIHGQHVEFCEKMLKAIREQPTVDAVPVPDGGIGELSDGYHTFNGLYYQRMMLFAALVKTYKNRAWKSRRHSDGEPCFGGGWFIVGIDTPQGGFTYHYEDEYFDLFDCVELQNGKEWDGHTEDDVTRLLTLDAVPVVHAYWIIKPHGTYDQLRAFCSACGKHSGIGGIVSNQKKPYCPNCGAIMDGKEIVNG